MTGIHKLSTELMDLIALYRERGRAGSGSRSADTRLTACGKTHPAFDGRSIPAEPPRFAVLCVALRSKYTRYSSLARLVSRAPRPSRRSRGFHHRLLSAGRSVFFRRRIRAFYQFDPEILAEGCGCAAHGKKGRRPVVGIEEPIERRAAGSHPGCHFGVRNALLLDGLSHLKREDSFDGGGPRLSERAILFKQFIEGRADVWIREGH